MSDTEIAQIGDEVDVIDAAALRIPDDAFLGGTARAVGRYDNGRSAGVVVRGLDAAGEETVTYRVPDPMYTTVDGDSATTYPLRDEHIS